VAARPGGGCFPENPAGDGKTCLFDRPRVIFFIRRAGAAGFVGRLT